MPAPRRFDHDQARRRHAAGESIRAIASDLSVNPTAVWRILDPANDAKMREADKHRYASVCETCGTPCLSARHAVKRLRPGHDGRDLCIRCRADERRERLRFGPNGSLISVRCLTIDCANGERWQSPDRFSRGVRHREVREGGIHSHCRACQTRERTNYRRRHLGAAQAYDREYKRRKRAKAAAGLENVAPATRLSTHPQPAS